MTPPAVDQKRLPPEHVRNAGGVCTKHHGVNLLLNPLGGASHCKEQIFSGIKSKMGTSSKLCSLPSHQESLILLFRTT